MAGMANFRTWLNLALRGIATASVGGSRGFVEGSTATFRAISELAHGGRLIRGQTVLSATQERSLTPRAAAFWSSAGFCGATPSSYRNAGLLGSVRGRSAAVGALVETRRTFASKLKHPKVKAYSSYKLRFRGLASGLYKRWKAGKRHNAHSKSNKQQRQLRRPSVCPPGLAKSMKSLNFQL